jgi:hypothetical protein
MRIRRLARKKFSRPSRSDVRDRDGKRAAEELAFRDAMRDIYASEGRFELLLI